MSHPPQRGTARIGVEVWGRGSVETEKAGSFETTGAERAVSLSLVATVRGPLSTLALCGRAGSTEGASRLRHAAQRSQTSLRRWRPERQRPADQAEDAFAAGWVAGRRGSAIAGARPSPPRGNRSRPNRLRARERVSRARKSSRPSRSGASVAPRQVEPQPHHVGHVQAIPRHPVEGSSPDQGLVPLNLYRQ